MLRLLYTVFVLSGAAGLIYEVIWTRYLGLFVGHSAYAQIIVLVIFLGGMSLGALLVGRKTERLRHPLTWYAGVEIVTGLIGLVFHDVFVATTNVAYATVFPSVGLGVAQTVAKWGIASLLILPQSILLGMTFPLMSAGVVRRVPSQTGRALSMLYFANSLGAAAGVLAAGFWLVAVAGLPGALLAAAMINLVVGVAVIIATRAERQNEEADIVPPPPRIAVAGLSHTMLWRLLLLVSLGTALSSFIYEIGWTRMLALVLGSATHSFELMLSAFILGLAAGAYWVRRRADASIDSIRLLGYVQLAMGALAVATLPVYLTSYKWMVSLLAALAKTPEGYTAFNLSRYFVCLAVMLPATFCAGMTLPLITRTLVGAGVGERAIGQVYGVNTFGSIIGAAVGGLVLLPLLGLKWMLVAGASLDVALGIALLLVHARRSPAPGSMWRSAPAVAIVAAALVMIVIPLRSDFDTTMLTSGVYRYGALLAPHSRDVLFYRDGRTASVSVSRVASGGLSLATNGKPDASLGPEWLGTVPIKPGPFTHDAMTQTFVPLVPLAYVPKAREVAVIGFGSGMTTHTLLGSPFVTNVSTIEIERQMIEGSRLFRPANRRAYEDRRSNLVIDDARAYFAASGRKFDLIISEPSNPWVSGVSGLFTIEFYARIKQYLTPNGIFAQWLHLYEIDDGLVLGVITALAQQFPTYSIYQLSGRDVVIIASSRPSLPAPDWSVVQYPLIAEDLRRVWPITPRAMETLHIADQRSLHALVGEGAANSDFYPMLDLNAERTRFMKSEAHGFAGIAAGRVNLAAVVDGRRNGLGDPYAVVVDVPRLQAMAVAAAMRSGDSRGGREASVARARAQLLDEEMASGHAPSDWRVWVQSVAVVEGALHGGMAGVADSAFYASVRRFAQRAGAPAEARASIDFMHGLAVWDFAEASRAADTLTKAAIAGDLWFDPDVLRDGAVLAKLETGDRASARDIFRSMMRLSTRDIADLRTRLLYALVSDTK